MLGPLLAVQPLCVAPGLGDRRCRGSSPSERANPCFSIAQTECRKMADQMSQMECSIETIINIFHQYSVRLGNRDTLNQKEFKQLVKKELPNFLKKQKRDEKAINHILEDLDTNVDKQLSFEEFSMLVAKLTVASHEEMHKTAPPGDGHHHGPGFGSSSSGPCAGQESQTPGGHGHGHSHGGHGHGHSH
ncbi:S100 calcium binding protein A9 isoform X1 [Sus scrofa]|uniref:S100 calcium binding protein A9 isoform X1 n=1 Tax=Sus scrofa TaxID=9823 RepID=UPI000A2B12DB|nr:S100 calcium binding protein A9 isoform X1 [Sus scrofa]